MKIGLQTKLRPFVVIITVRKKKHTVFYTTDFVILHYELQDQEGLMQHLKTCFVNQRSLYFFIHFSKNSQDAYSLIACAPTAVLKHTIGWTVINSKTDTVCYLLRTQIQRSQT